MARYLVRVKGTTNIYCRKNAECIADLQYEMDADDDPSAFEFTEDRRHEAARNWRPLIPVGEHYIPSLGAVPAVVMPEIAKIAGCGVSEA